MPCSPVMCNGGDRSPVYCDEKAWLSSNLKPPKKISCLLAIAQPGEGVVSFIIPFYDRTSGATKSLLSRQHRFA